MLFWRPCGRGRLALTLAFLCLSSLQPGCTRPPASQPVPVDPVEEERKKLEAMKQAALAEQGAEDPAKAASALVFLELDAQARFEMYKAENAEEVASGGISPEALEIRRDIGRFLAAMQERELHLVAVDVDLPFRGLTPLGAALREVARTSLLPAPQPDLSGEEANSSDEGEETPVKGRINMLKLFYDGVSAVEITRVKPKLEERAEFSQYGVKLCDAILDIFAAENFPEIAFVKQDKKLIAGYKRNIRVTKKRFHRFAKAR